MERRVELFYSKNGTVHVVSQESPPPVFSFFITLFCFICGVSHNLIVTSAVFSDHSLRSSSVHQMLALLSLTCLLDCLTNQSVAVGLLFNDAISWCSLSAVLFPLFLLLHAATLALFCVERTLTLYKLPLTPETRLLGQLSVCLFGILFSLPLLAAGEVHYFRNRNSCGAVLQNAWAAVLFLLSVLLCWTCQVVYLVVVVRKQPLQTITFSPIPSMSSPAGPVTSYEVDVASTRTCSSVMLLYVILLTPLSVSVVVTHFLPLALEPDPWLDPGDLQPRSVSTPDLELLLTFLRYMYNVAVPVAVLSSDVAVRQQARRVFCCSNNAVSSQAIVLTQPASPRHVRAPSFTTPVLFSTPEGIHLRVAHQEDSTSDSVRLVTQFCDLIAEPGYAFGNKENDRGGNLRSFRENQTSLGEHLRSPRDNWRSPELNSRSPEENWRNPGENLTNLAENRANPGEQRIVRFSSKVEAVSLTGFTSGSEHDDPRHSDTRTILNPVHVRGQGDHPVHTDRTYSKF